VYELLEERYGTRPKEAVERIEVVSASPDESMLLDVPGGAPLLAITRTTTDTQDEPFEFSNRVCLGPYRVRVYPGRRT